MKPCLIALLLLLTTFGWGQSKFQWYEGSCLFSARFDSTQFTYNQIQNVYYFFIEKGTPQQAFLPDNPNDIPNLNLTAVEKECQQFIESYSKLDLPNTSFWQSKKNLEIEQLKQSCELRKQIIEALRHPKSFKPKNYPSSCKLYVKAIRKGGKLLLNTWKELHRLELINAVDSASLERDFLQKWNSEKRKEHAQIDVMKYGFWNCLLQNEELYNQELTCKQAFLSLFTQLEKSCQ